MDNPEQIQLLTTNQSREESERSREALEKSADVEKIKKVTVSQKRYVLTVITLIVVIVALLVALLAALLLSGSGKDQKEKVVTCWTKECLGLTSMLKNYQNLSVDPCDDFFEHTCGRLYEHVRDDSSLGFVHYRRLLRQVFHIVSSAKKFDTKPKEQMRIFAKKCMDRRGMDRDNFEDLRDDIEKRGGFPMIDMNWDESKFDLSDLLANYIKINRNRIGFLSVEPYSTIKNNQTVNLLYVSPGPHFLYNLIMSLVVYKEAAKAMIQRLLKLQNRTLDDMEFERDYQQLIYLESNLTTLANYETMEYDTDNMSKQKTLTELAVWIPELDWVKIIRAMPREDLENADFVEKELFNNVRVHGGGDYFFGEKRELARIITKTPKRVLANYVVVRQLIDVALFFYDKDQPRRDKFYGHDSASSFCATQLAYFFPMPSMNVFIQKSGYRMENLKIVAKIFDDVKKEYADIFTKNSYLEPDVRDFLLRKLKAIVGTFAHQQYIEPSPLLDKMYETLNFLETDTPYQIYMKMWRHRTEQLVDHIVYNTPLDPVNMRQFALHAAYQSYQNNFYINIAYLTFPWMDASLPSYSNYAYVGYIIGHEIGHAFDHFHRKIDENGKVHKYWLTETNSSNIAYNKREKCLRDQYSEYKEPGYDYFMNGTKSRYEIAGDHMGVRTSYRAFKNQEKEDTVKLPGFDGVSADQLFFYNYALRYCDIYNDQMSEYVMKARTHPTSRFRVNGVLQNIPEFSEAFECPKDSNMNSKEKCELY